jgi:hypothetical protein
MHWSHAASRAATLVQTAEQLNLLSDILAAAVACGIDCEWPPEQTAGSPAAALVQLATWSATHGLRVLLLDMVNLPRDAARGALQALFRNKCALKVGFSMGSDLRAVAAALGPDGGNAVAVVAPALDVGELHRLLLHHGAPGVIAQRGPGLSGIVHAQLGRPLDKVEQCSAWGARPLTKEQLRYGANDACCLLALLDDLIQHVGQPSEWPAAVPEGEESAGGSTAADAVSSPAAAPAADEKLPKTPAAPSQQVSPPGPVSVEEHTPSPARRTAALSWSPEQLEAAAAAWGARLEVSGGRARWRDRAGRLHARPWRLQAGEVGASASPAGSPAPPDFPAHVPWLDARRRLTAPPKFLCDVMAAGLARQLRLWGVDAEAVEAADKAQRHAVHRQLVERAEAEARVILTRDVAFLRRNLSDSAYHVRANTKREQLKEVVAAFNLPVGEAALLSRCARCNGQFLERPVAREALPEGHGVPAAVVERRQEFWVCSRADCRAVYWQGSMFERAIGRLMGDLASMQVAAAAGAGAGAGGGSSTEAGAAQDRGAAGEACLQV